MVSRKWIAVMVAVGIIALFIPFIPQTTSSGRFFGAQYERTATVSPSYYVFHCGSYMNNGYTAQLGSGYAGFDQLSKGYTFSCVYTSAG